MNYQGQRPDRESFTFLAIIVGTTLASALTQAASGRFGWPRLCLAVAVIGLIASSSSCPMSRQRLLNAGTHLSR